MDLSVRQIDPAAPVIVPWPADPWGRPYVVYMLYQDGVDPQTGWPIQDAPRSITVAADTCTQAGMLSTLAMLQGKGAESFLSAQDVKFWCDRGEQ